MASKNVKTQAVTSKKELRGKVLLNWIQSAKQSFCFNLMTKLAKIRRITKFCQAINFNLDGGMQKDSSKALSQQNKMQKLQNL